jgi:putative endonuclease
LKPGNVSGRRRNTLGKYGEEFAKKYFEQEGYVLVAQNHRYERAEIDLIFKDEKKKILVFVEVKTRRSKAFGEPEESVTEMKQAQLIKSAEGFLMSRDEFYDYEKRFDVASIYIEGKIEKINHIENAF